MALLKTIAKLKTIETLEGIRFLRQAAEKRIGRIICRSVEKAGTSVKWGLKELVPIKVGVRNSELL